MGALLARVDRPDRDGWEARAGQPTRQAGPVDGLGAVVDDRRVEPEPDPGDGLPSLGLQGRQREVGGAPRPHVADPERAVPGDEGPDRLRKIRLLDPVDPAEVGDHEDVPLRGILLVRAEVQHRRKDSPRPQAHRRGLLLLQPPQDVLDRLAGDRQGEDLRGVRFRGAEERQSGSGERLAEVVDDLAQRRHRPGPRAVAAEAEPHGHGVVHDDHVLRGRERGGGRKRLGLEERSRHEHGQQQDQQRPQEEQQQVLEPDAAAVAELRLEQPLHRRPLHDPETAAVQQVDDDGNRGEESAPEQQAVHEAHVRPSPSARGS
jgi:hypothetical protein